MFKLGDGALWRQWAPVPLRLVIGYGFIAHGWAKLSRGPAGFARLLDQIGAPLPEVTAWVSTFTEILGGVAILAGAFVAVVSVPLISSAAGTATVRAVPGACVASCVLLGLTSRRLTYQRSLPAASTDGDFRGRRLTSRSVPRRFIGLAGASSRARSR
jgi:uncharacterized membrane protein YphA (DoxX/SURF4 family)